MAGNVLLTIDMITRGAVALFRNSNLFIKNIDAQYDNAFAIDGAKIGDSLRIRLPNDFVVSDGPALSVQDTAEQYTNLTLQYQRHVDVSFTSKEKTLSLDNYTELFLMPMMNNLAGNVAATIMNDTVDGFSNYVANLDGSGNVISPTSTTVLEAGANLDNNSAPTMPGRKLIDSPTTDARITSTLSGLFNPSSKISEQYQTGEMKNALGFDFYKDQTVVMHTSGTFSAGTVSGANQTGSVLTVNAITGTLTKGDIITIDGVFAVNRVTKQSLGTLRQIVVTANVADQGTVIPIYPALTPAQGGQAVQYQTVTASPADGAAIRLVSKASEVYRKNFAYSPKAITMGTADLIMPPNVESARRMYDGISMRAVTQYVVGTDQLATRLDVIFGSRNLRGEWGVIVADRV